MSTPDGPDLLKLFQAGRLNKNIPEHLEIIKRWLAYFQGTPEYSTLIEKYRLDPVPPPPVTPPSAPVVEESPPEAPKEDPLPAETAFIGGFTVSDETPVAQEVKDSNEEEELNLLIAEKGIKIHHKAGLAKKREAVKEFLLSQLQ